MLENMGDWITDTSNSSKILVGSVLIDVLAVAAAQLAVTSWEIQFATWLTFADWLIFGSNNVGFDISEINWTPDSFTAQKDYLLKVIQVAMKRETLAALPYTPTSTYLNDLHGFEKMIKEFKFDPSKSKPSKYWPREGAVNFGIRCPQHQIFLHFEGCMICNNAPIDTLAELLPCKSSRRKN